MIRVVQVFAYECICEVPGCPRNGEPWLSIAKRPPSVCTTCKSREWNGKKIKRKPAKAPKIDLPKPVKVREAYDDEF